MLVSLSEYRSLSTKPGIYLFLNEEGKILYVGKAKNLRKRVSSYFLNGAVLETKTNILISQVKSIRTIVTNSEIEAFLLEAEYIKKYKPKYNIKLKDDKAYPMVRITIKDDYPKVLIARKRDDKKSIYIGPFPNTAQALRLTLKTVRKIFPYQSVQNHAKRVCLYNHLGLCPCPPTFDSPQFKIIYRENIKHLISFLQGKTKEVIKELKTERDAYSSNEEFEKAKNLQDQINAIEMVTSPAFHIRLPHSELGLNIDAREREVSNLTTILSDSGVNVENLERIECFDISNIQGTNATGSMVAFTNGVKDGNWYRKFKIKTLTTPNDFAMMSEVLKRRLNHKDWPYPDLIVVDGGKGQVSTAVKVLTEMNLKIPLIGLAKREETIVASDLKEISLPKDSDALKLIMRIRDEAHRFAITYHRKLRSKSFLSK